MEHELLGYLLRLDDPEALARTESDLKTDPELATRLGRLARALAPLEADREPPLPPADLVARTVGRVAQHLIEAGEPPAEGLDEPPVREAIARLTPQRLRTLIEIMDRSAAVPTRSRRIDVIVAGSLVLLAVGLVLGAVPYLRHRQNVVVCQNNLRAFHGALTTYSETHGGWFPQVGETPEHRTAASVWSLLRDAGTLGPRASEACPAADTTLPTYAYSLGYRDQAGNLYGLRREPDQTNDLLPILADRPPPSRDGVGPDHGNGQNVLYVGGHAAFCTSPRVGVNGDDIYRNQFGEISAGLHRWDTVLGVGSDVP